MKKSQTRHRARRRRNHVEAAPGVCRTPERLASPALKPCTGAAPAPLPVRGKIVHLAGPGDFTTACNLWIERKAHRLPTSMHEGDVNCSKCRRGVKAGARRAGDG